MGCIESEQLLDTALGRAGAVLAGQVRDHLSSGCHRCQSNWEWIQRIVQLTATDDSVEPPRWLMQRALELFETHGPQRRPTLWQRIVASLVFDSLIQPQPLAVRQTAQGMRQVLYQAGEWEVDVSLEPGEGPEAISITGQVLKERGSSPEVAGVPVHLIQGEQIYASTAANRLGEFTFDHIAPGSYGVSIEMADHHLWIDHLDVRLSH